MQNVTYDHLPPGRELIGVYHNVEGRFTAGANYQANTDKTEIKVSIFEDLTVDVNNIFKWWLN